MASVLEPLLASSLAADCAASSFQSANTTEAPDSAKALAVARPSPDAAPVTRATWPSKGHFMGRRDIVTPLISRDDGPRFDRKQYPCTDAQRGRFSKTSFAT